jgi:phage terminase large subunit-like protein
VNAPSRAGTPTPLDDTRTLEDLEHPEPGFLSVAQVFTHLDPSWLGTLSRAERVVLSRAFDVWIRPEQQIPTHLWKTLGMVGGRGFGKSAVVSRYVNERVMAGLELHVALMAPTEARTQEVQVRSLIDYAEPGQAPVPFTRLKTAGLRWPNGVEAVFFTPEAPGRSRSENLSLTWCTELVDWKPSTRKEAFDNLFTATRVGEARLIWDSTAKGRNEVRTLLETWHNEDPHTHVIIPGTMFDNPLLDTPYLRSQWQLYGGVRRDEELGGMSFRESAGACWKQEYFDRTRVAELPPGGLEWFYVAVDPATSTYETADETGIVAGGRGRRDGHAYVTDDATGKHGPNEWGDISVDLADPRKPGPEGSRRGRLVIERKHLGDSAAFTIKSRAESKGLRTRVLGKDEPWPAFDGTCIFIREQNTNLSKGTRAEGPAAESDGGRAHLVDPGYPDQPRFADLEKECTTYVPGVTKRSPNRLDALVYLVIEIRELKLDSPPDHGAAAAQAIAMNKALADSLARAHGPSGRSADFHPALVGGGGGRMGL